MQTKCANKKPLFPTFVNPKKRKKFEKSLLFFRLGGGDCLGRGKHFLRMVGVFKEIVDPENRKKSDEKEGGFASKWLAKGEAEEWLFIEMFS